MKRPDEESNHYADCLEANKKRKFDCICEEIYFAYLDSQADNQMETMRGN